jgi:hypothetical protein
MSEGYLPEWGFWILAGVAFFVTLLPELGGGGRRD